jgi:tetratricopeptide (TPR) repeat protein
LGNIGGARCALGEEEGLDDLRKALNMALSRGQTIETSLLYNNLGYSMEVFHGPKASTPVFRELVAFRKRRGLHPIFGVGSLMGALGELGEFDEALALAQDLGMPLETPESTFDLMEVRSSVARILARRGQFSHAVEHVDWAIEYARRAGEAQDAVIAFPVAVTIRAGLGETDVVRALLSELTGIQGVGNEPEFATRLPEMVRLAFGVGAPELADALVRICGTVTPVQEHALCSVAGLLAEHRGDLEGATRSFEDAASRWNGFGVVWEEAHALLGLGRCHTALRHPDARTRLIAARAIFERLGATPALAETDAYLARTAASAS